jgi:hypothetical protein
MNFNTMTLNELSRELDSFNRQLINQQASQIPITDKQKKRWHALSKAYKKASIKAII